MCELRIKFILFLFAFNPEKLCRSKRKRGKEQISSSRPQSGDCECFAETFLSIFWLELHWAQSDSFLIPWDHLNGTRDEVSLGSKAQTWVFLWKSDIFPSTEWTQGCDGKRPRNQSVTYQTMMEFYTKRSIHYESWAWSTRFNRFNDITKDGHGMNNAWMYLANLNVHVYMF